MKLIARKTNDGRMKGNTAFYCKMLHVSRQGFYKYLVNKDRLWNYQPLADAMLEILAEDECNDTYGRIRMYQALLLKQPEHVDIPSERTVYRIMEEIGLSHHPKRRPKGITKADHEARKSDDLLKRNFQAAKPLIKCVTDRTEIKANNGKLYVLAIFDCFDLSVIGLAMDTNQKTPFCVQTLENAYKAYPAITSAVIHSDRGTQDTSRIYRNAISKYGIQQSRNSAGGRCHENTRCESMWARMKSELLYERYLTEKMTTNELKVLIWRFMRGLIYKDFLLFFKGIDKKVILIAIAAIALILIKTGVYGGLLSIIMFAMTIGIQNVMAFDNDEKVDWKKQQLALPINEYCVVASKYISVVCTLVISILGGLVFSLPSSVIHSYFSSMMLQLSMLSAMIVPLIWTGICLPLTYWFGFRSAQTMGIIIVIPMFYIIKFFEDGPGLLVIPTSIDFYQFIACFAAIIIFGLSFIISVIGYSRKR